MAFSSQGVGAPNFAMLDQVRSYWHSLRVGSALPMRDAVEPRGMAEALESTFLIERIAPGMARFRIAGLHVQDLIGLDVRGMPLATLFEPPARPRLAKELDTVFSAPAALEMWLEGERGIGRPTLDGRMLLLPLSDGQGSVSMALGCLAMAGGMGRAPRRFAITGLLREVFARHTAAPSGKTPDDFAPMPTLRKMAQIHPQPDADRPKAHLRLVYSRD
ncbi:MAG: PAS domain-containing protein [Pseudomonadota bacterium]